jgi:hypothetical protein
MQPPTGIGKAAEDHPRQRRCFGQRIGNGLDGNAGRTIRGETINACRDSGVRDRAEAVDLTELKPAAIAGAKQRIFVLMAAVPDRADGMDHVFGGEPVAHGDLGVAGFAAAKRAAFGEQLGPGGAVDGAIDATAAEQRGIRGVDNRVNA